MITSAQINKKLREKTGFLFCYCAILIFSIFLQNNMTLGTHIVIGAAATRVLGATHPILGFFIGLASHYLSDFIPHWDYKLSSLSGRKTSAERRWGSKKLFVLDLGKIAIDFFVGAIIVAIFWPNSFTQSFFLLAAIFIGSTLPDFLEGLYFTTKFALILNPHQRFHDFMHTKIKLGAYPTIGIPSQIIIFLLSLYFIS